MAFGPPRFWERAKRRIKTAGVALAAVTAEGEGPAAGLALLDALLTDAGEPARRFQRAAAIRAYLLDRPGRGGEAIATYDAITLTHDHAERQYLRHRRSRLWASSCGRNGPWVSTRHGAELVRSRLAV